MNRPRVPLRKFVKEYSVRNKANEDIPVYSVTNSQGFCTEYFGKEVASHDKTTYKIVPRGYFAYNPSRINVGSVDWQRCEERVIVSPLYTVFSVSDEIDCQYLYYFLRSDFGKQMIKARASGSVRDNLKLEMLKEMTIPDISIEEQHFCAQILDRLQILIQLRKQELQKLDELIKARFIELFGSSPEGNITIQECCKKISGGGTPSMQHPEYYGGDIPFIKSGDVKTDRITTGVLSLTSEALTSGRAKLVPEGTVIVVIRSAALLHEFHVAVTDNSVVINQDLKALYPADGIVPEFLMWSIKSQEQYLLSKVQTMLTSHIPMDILLELKVHKATLDEQMEFVKFAGQVDKSKAAVQKSLDETQVLFDSLMQKYFG